MLVVSRKRSESILVGNDVKITVIDVRGENVRIGIEAPTSILVLRNELLNSRRKDDNEIAT